MRVSSVFHFPLPPLVSWLSAEFQPRVSWLPARVLPRVSWLDPPGPLHAFELSLQLPGHGHRARILVLGSSEFGVVSTAAIESCAYLEAGTLEVGTLEVGTLEVGTLETGTLEAGTLETGTLEVGTLEAGTLEAGTYLEDASPVCSTQMLLLGWVCLLGCLLGWVCRGVVVEGACLRDWVCW